MTMIFTVEEQDYGCRGDCDGRNSVFAAASTVMEEQARQIVEMGEEASISVMFQLAKTLAAGGDPKVPGDAANQPRPKSVALAVP